MQTMSETGLHAVPERPGVRPAMTHAWRGLELLLEFVKIKAVAQKDSAQKTGIQLGATAVFAAFAAVWAELSLFFALELVVPPVWAAVLTLIANGLALGTVNLLVKLWKRPEEVEGEARRKKDDVAYELRTARDELLAVKDSVVEGTSQLVREKVLVPIDRYKMPAAIGVTFVTGMAAALALFPPERQERELLLNEGDVRGLI